MAIANTSITDTYFVWLARVNQMATSLNALDTSNVSSIVSNSSPLVVNGDTKRNSTLYLTLSISSSNADVSTTNIASPFLVNTAAQIARGAFLNANSTLVTASAAFAAANNANLSAGAAYAQANASFITASAAFAAANASPGSLALATAQSAYDLANTVNTRSISAYAQANAAFITTSASYAQANAAFITTSASYAQANAAFSKANVVANTGVAGISRFATASEFRTGTANTISLDPYDTWQSALEVSLTDAATISVDMSTFFNANVTLGGNRTLGTPSNIKPGQTGYIKVIQDGTGSRTLAYSSGWVFPSGTAPVLSTPAGSIDMLFYQSMSSNVLVTAIKAIG